MLGLKLIHFSKRGPRTTISNVALAVYQLSPYPPSTPKQTSLLRQVFNDHLSPNPTRLQTNIWFVPSSPDPFRIHKGPIMWDLSVFCTQFMWGVLREVLSCFHKVSFQRPAPPQSRKSHNTHISFHVLSNWFRTKRLHFCQGVLPWDDDHIPSLIFGSTQPIIPMNL